MKKIILSAMLTFTLAIAAQDRIARIDSVFAEQFAKGRFNGNVLIAEKGNVIYQKSFGLRNEETKEPLDANSIFELASVSKQFTAMGIVMLKEKKKLDFDDKLSKFIPELSFYGDITLRQLLNHTSGLPDYMELFDKEWDHNMMATNQDIIAMMATYKPKADFVPGTKFEYSNTGYALLASVIERASGMSYGDFLSKNIFVPLKMDRTLVYRRRYAPQKVENYAMGYILDNAGKKILPDNFPQTAMVVWLDGIVGDGMVNSTTVDLLKWDRALYTDKLASKKSMEMIFTPPVLPGGKKSDYGFGWSIENSKYFGKITSHTGGWPGYTTRIERDIDNDKTIIILQNNDLGYSPPMNVIRRLLYDMPVITKHTEVPLAVEKMQAYIGEYELGEGFTMTITYENGLMTQLTGQQKFQVYPESETSFFLKVVDAQLEFVKDEKGSVTEVILHQNGHDTHARKVK